MITKENWIIMLVQEHFLVKDTMDREEYDKYVRDAEDKIKFKKQLEFNKQQEESLQ